MLFGGRHFSGYGAHPWAGRNAPGGHSDAGRYQFVKRTWESVARALGLHYFSPESQDKGLGILRSMPIAATTGHVLLGDLRSHHFNPAGLAGTWVSMAKRTGSWMQHFFNPNMARALSHHDAGMHGDALRHFFGHPHHNRERAVPPPRQNQPEKQTHAR